MHAKHCSINAKSVYYFNYNKTFWYLKLLVQRHIPLDRRSGLSSNGCLMVTTPSTLFIKGKRKRIKVCILIIVCFPQKNNTTSDTNFAISLANKLSSGNESWPNVWIRELLCPLDCTTAVGDQASTIKNPGVEKVANVRGICDLYRKTFHLAWLQQFW